jgi:hypothetical protein
MNTETVNKLLKYVVQGAIIYSLFKYVPKEPMRDQEIIMISVIVVLAYAVFENLASIMKGSEHMSPVYNLTQQSGSCPCASSSEHMTSTIPLPVVSTPVVSTPIVPVVLRPVVSTPVVHVAPKVQEVKSMPIFAEPGNSQMFNQVDNSEFVDFNTLPSDNGLDVDSEYGESFLPPSKWYPVPPHPPICKTDNKCPVCPVYTTGTFADLREVKHY